MDPWFNKKFCNRFKSLPENLVSFEMMTVWSEPEIIPPLKPIISCFD